MKEDFLHYVWQYKKFDFSNLATVDGELLTILDNGSCLQKQGPDFFNATIIIGEQKWAGNVEIHVKSSDWYLHNHQKDDNYDNVILHVVWEHNIPIFRKDNTEIPVLELRKYIPIGILENYKTLMCPKSWIFCENHIASVDGFVLRNWQERLFFERLERKHIPIAQLLSETKKDWEAVLFCMLARNFGLNTNGEAFFEIAKSIPFSVIRKERHEAQSLESLLMGMADLFPDEAHDSYAKNLKNHFDYLMQKYHLKQPFTAPVQFFKHRPDNFPTIRLAQLASVYAKEENLFSKIIDVKELKELYQLFAIDISDYWQTHYQFDKPSPKKKKQLSKSFVDLLVINTIIPIQFAYAKNQGKEVSQTLLDLLRQAAPEKNAIIDRFTDFGVKAKNAFESQSLLQLKNEYCNHAKCFRCAVGIQFLKH